MIHFSYIKIFNESIHDLYKNDLNPFIDFYDLQNKLQEIEIDFKTNL